MRVLFRWLTLAAASFAASGDKPSLRGVDQILVFDAGSSGTRVHVFNIDGGSAGSGVPGIDLSKRKSKKIKPGLSHYAREEDLDGAQKSIEELLFFANQYVARRSDTPVLLKATAGLRAVGQLLADKVLNRVRETLCTSGYKFSYHWAGIIKGKEEGGLAWVAANYLRGAFMEGRSIPAVGVVELGGGSTQVTFQLEDQTPLAESDSFTFTTLAGVTYHLYAHSYLGYGQDYTKQNYTEAIKSAAEDPCMARGVDRDFDGTKVIGAGDGAKCRENVEAVINWQLPTSPGLYPDEQSPQGSFVVTENFFYTRKGFVPEAEGYKLDSESMKADASMACAKTYDNNPDPSSDAFKDEAQRCYALCYQAALLQHVGLTKGDTDVTVVHEIGGSEVDWALGAALVSYMEVKQGHGARAECPNPPVGGFTKVTIIVLSLFGAASIFLWKGPFRKQLSGNSEDPVAVVSKGSPRLSKRSHASYNKIGASEPESL